MSKLWSGRFSKESDKFVDEINSSIKYDWRLFPYDIKGNIAQVKMLEKQGILFFDESLNLVKELKNLEKEFSSKDYKFPIEDEDIHMHIEKRLIEKLGDTAKKIHAGRSRNDQVILDVRMFVKDHIKLISYKLLSLQKAITDKAEEYKDVIIPGYTHMQRAQPVLFSHHFLAYYEKLTRDFQSLVHCYREADYMPLGSGAIAGTTLPTDREYLRELLGFSKLTTNSMDAVSDRDFIISLMFSISKIAIHLSRFAEELVLWSSSEFSLVKIDESFTTGSSIMPQKRNPDLAELVRGKSGRAIGNLVSLLVTLKGLPLTYNKDLQEDKEPLFDSVDTILLVLEAMDKMISTLSVNGDRAKELLKGGFLTATDMAEYLVKKDLPFREAHNIVGKIVAYCEKKGVELDQLSFEEYRNFSELFEEDIVKLLSPEKSVEGRDILGGTAINQVNKQIRLAKRDILWRETFTESSFRPF